jgi:hypothetical protein
MKRKLYVYAIALVAVCVMAGCGSKESKEGSKESKDTVQVAEAGTTEAGATEASYAEASETDSQADEEIVAMIKAVYDDVDIVYSTSGEGEPENNIDLMTKYGSKRFCDLVQQVRKIDAGKAEGNRFVDDWDELLSYWGVGQCQVTDDFETTVDGNTAKAKYWLFYSGQYALYELALVKEDGKWRIDDMLQIGNDTGSKVEQMTKYIKENR